MVERVQRDVIQELDLKNKNTNDSNYEQIFFDVKESEL